MGLKGQAASTVQLFTTRIFLVTLLLKTFFYVDFIGTISSTIFGL